MLNLAMGPTGLSRESGKQRLEALMVFPAALEDDSMLLDAIYMP